MQECTVEVLLCANKTLLKTDNGLALKKLYIHNSLLSSSPLKQNSKY
jgi:hypothetical protein